MHLHPRASGWRLLSRKQSGQEQIPGFWVSKSQASGLNGKISGDRYESLAFNISNHFPAINPSESAQHWAWHRAGFREYLLKNERTKQQTNEL